MGNSHIVLRYEDCQLISKNHKYYWKTQHTIKEESLLRFRRGNAFQKKYDWIEYDDGIYINMYRNLNLFQTLFRV